MKFAYKPVHVTPRQPILKNRFLQSAVLLASLAIPSQGQMQTDSTEKPFVKYDCDAPVVTRGSPVNYNGVPFTEYIQHSKTGDTIFLGDSIRMYFRLEPTPDAFTYKSGIVYIGLTPLTYNFTVQFLTDSSLILTTTRSWPRVYTTMANCHCAASDGKMRAVFIRPGCAPGQFYNAFGGNGNEAVTVGGGTLESSAQDLLNSGVTDIFIAFKTDFPWSALGHSGDLLFDSKEGGYEDTTSHYARQNGFDPISAFMNACQAAYAAAGKKVRFHAWFPVFKDEYAVRFGFQRGNANSGLVENALDAASHLVSGKDYDCQSKTAAEPSNPVVVRYELTALEELMAIYPLLSGINLDYIRYSLNADPCCEGGDETKDIEPHTWNVKPTAIEDFVKKVRAEFPNVILSADVFADAQMRVDVGQAGILQYLDMIMPMAYSYESDGTSATVQTWVTQIRSQYPNKLLVPLLRGWSRGITNPHSNGLIPDLTSDLSAAKTVKIDGYAIFTYELLLNDALVQKLSEIKKEIGY